MSSPIISRKGQAEGYTLWEVIVLIAVLVLIGLATYAGTKLVPLITKEPQTQQHFNRVAQYIKGIDIASKENAFYFEKELHMLVESGYFIVGFDREHDGYVLSECLGDRRDAFGPLPLLIYKPGDCLEKACLCLYDKIPEGIAGIAPGVYEELKRKPELTRSERKELESIEKAAKKGVVQCEPLSGVDTISSRAQYYDDNYPLAKFNQNLGLAKQQHALLKLGDGIKDEYEYGYLVLSGGGKCRAPFYQPGVWRQSLYIEKLFQGGRTHLLIVPYGPEDGDDIPEIKQELDTRIALLNMLQDS
jgi:hypothetical protein